MGLFCSTATTAPHLRAGKLLAGLSGEAWQAAEVITPESLKHEQGVEQLLNQLSQETEGVEYNRQRFLMSSGIS